jgi:hypothetical protein
MMRVGETYAIGEKVSILQKLRRNVRGYAILMGEGFLHKPWRMLVSFTVERILKERPEVKLAVHLAIATDMLLVDKCFIAGGVVKSDEIAGEGVALYRAVRAPDHREFCLFADCARGRVAVS